MRGKRILALILSLSMVLSLFPLTFAFAEDEETSKYANEIEFLKTLEIFDEDFDKDKISARILFPLI